MIAGEDPALGLAANAQNFAQPKVILVGQWPIAIYTADFNEDGYPDLLYINANSNGTDTLTVLLNNGKGNFTQSWTMNWIQQAARRFRNGTSFILPSSRDKRTWLISAGFGRRPH